MGLESTCDDQGRADAWMARSILRPIRTNDILNKKIYAKLMQAYKVTLSATW